MNNEENINIYAVYTVITGKKDLYDKIHEQDKKFKEYVQDLIVIIVVVIVVGGMLLYAHYDITGIVNG